MREKLPQLDRQQANAGATFGAMFCRRRGGSYVVVMTPIRSVAITPRLGETFWQQRRRSKYVDDQHRVFCHPTRGSRVDPDWYTERFRDALEAAGITDYIRPFHDMRHTALTNYAAATGNPVALMATAGHRSFATTKGYLQLAGITFADEAAQLEQRLYGGRKFYPSDSTSDDPTVSEPLSEAVADPA